MPNTKTPETQTKSLLFAFFSMEFEFEPLILLSLWEKKYSKENRLISLRQTLDSRDHCKNRKNYVDQQFTLTGYTIWNSKQTNCC